MATLADLKRAVGDYLDRADIQWQVPTFLTSAQARLERTYLPLFLVVHGHPLQLVGNTAVLPNDILRIRALRLWLPSGQSVALDEVPETRGRIYLHSGTPANVFWREGSTVVLPAIPQAGSRLELDYYRREPVPTLDTDTNAWISNAFDVVMYAVLGEASTYLLDSDAANMYWAEAEGRLLRLRDTDVAYEWDTPTAIRMGDGRL